MIFKIKRDKFGRLTSDPIFRNGRVVFPAFENLKLVREDEIWEADIIEEIPLNKVDRKGQPMFRGIVRLLNPVISAVIIRDNGSIEIMGENSSMQVDEIDERYKMIKVRGEEYVIPDLYIVHRS
jgi:hypothetical protein